MANTKQALKRHRQSLKARSRNRVVKSHVKNAVKAVRSAVQANDLDQAREALQRANSVLDKAAGKGVIHKNNAHRRVSRLNKAVNKMAQMQ
ncbi:30S ribosomal protein S20 [Desulfovermiculus halophilus]|uniref:30S ribosomal protein S20 n=1 Tax=Desulfovermiculus halophilus TaxID=339722 RepID=UPI0004818C2B|nr:30S ribosomal protein S20 [Desulfovermiculus halophilus]